MTKRFILSSHFSFKDGAVSLTFDDGWRSAHSTAYPILTHTELAATFFAVSGFCDDTLFPHNMNIQELRELQEAGHEIGCHTSSHKHLINETPIIANEEIALSKDYFNKNGLVIDSFAYPYGEYNSMVMRCVQKAGFKGARITEQGYNYETADPFMLKSFAVKAETQMGNVRAWVDAARNRHAWLILMFHQVDREGREWSTTPEQLKTIVEYLRVSDMRNLTIREGLKKLMRASSPSLDDDAV